MGRQLAVQQSGYEQVWLEDEIDLREYVDVLLKYWWVVIALPLLAVIVAGVMGFFVMTPVYQSEAGLVFVGTRTEVSFEPRLVETQAEADRSSRVKALISLATSSAIGAEVMSQIGEQLAIPDLTVPQLTGMVTAKSDGDYISIIVQDTDAERAALIANTWARAYERYVNALYGEQLESMDRVQTQVADAKSRYDKAQQALESFIGSNRVDDLRREIDFRQTLLGNMQASKTSLISSYVAKQMAVRGDLIAAYLEARNTARQAIFREQLEARTKELAHYYDLDRRLARLIADATSFREELAQSASSAPAEAGDLLSLLLLQASSFVGSASLPVQLQMHMDSLAQAPASKEEMLQDLDTLTGVLQSRRVAVQEDIAALQQELLASEGYQELEAVPAPGDPLYDAAQEHLQAALELEDMQPPVPETGEDALSLWIQSYSDQLQRLREQLEAEEARSRELHQERDLAWETYQSLARKQAEVQVAAGVGATNEVRLAVSAAPGVTPVKPRKMMMIGVAGALGLMVGVFGAFVINFFAQEPRRQDSRRVPAQDSVQP